MTRGDNVIFCFDGVIVNSLSNIPANFLPSTPTTLIESVVVDPFLSDHAKLGVADTVHFCKNFSDALVLDGVKTAVGPLCCGRGLGVTT